MCKVTIDGITVQAPEGSTILDAAKLAGVDIPTLCFMKEINEIGSCRVCVVEVEGEDALAAACNTPVFDGMAVRTNTPRVIAARRANVETILATHRSECTTCKRSGTCALQAVANGCNAADLGRDPDYEFEAWDETFPLQRDATKCIRCMRCVAECAKVQQCAVWEVSGPAAHRGVRVAGGADIASANCALCGQCVTHCPTGALTACDDTSKVLAALADPQVITVVQVAPAIRSAWGEGVGVPREEATQGRMVSALRALGFNYVYDTDFAADLTIMEEANEFIEWVKAEKPRPMFTSCCPGWVRFAKQHYPQFVGQLSTSKSPHEMLGATAKALMSQSADKQDKRVFVVSVMPCIAKKYEASVPQLSTEAGKDVDAVLTTREFDRMLRMFNVNCADLPEGDFDDPLGLSTGAGTIFGRTGGVMEAALRSAAFFLTGEKPDFSTCDTTAATPERPWVDKTLDIAGMQLRIAIASGLSNTAALLDALEAGAARYDFVEIMACPGGCVGGGGQPIAFNQELARERASVLNALDGADTLRFSHENPDIKALYDRLLGEPLSEKAEELLHTNQAEWDI
ncbi:[FeFe] hydrogenase, group A [uncultured Slackia sp.]|uniref:[FeFe] hydrogenase, group A n=1 Tax=uncultured Slackia sp. TaxID=665903 RepID=UPI0025EBB52F|nr:[FeFe] hydrogenase, group A [uncultured Slackia sp.]